MVTALSTLRSKLEKATGPDRELDLLVGAWWPGPPRQIGETSGRPFNLSLKRMRNGLPPCWEFTASIDASLALVERVLPGWSPDIGRDWYAKDYSYECRLYRDLQDYERKPAARPPQTAPTLPLAILIALINALEQEKPDG